MIDGGMAMIYVGDLEQSLDFYTDTLNLTLLQRFSDDFAILEAGPDLKIGLRQANQYSPQPGARGAISIGFSLDEPIEDARRRLEDLGVEFVGPIRGNEDAPVRITFFQDPDGTRLYFQEFWEKREAMKK